MISPPSLNAVSLYIGPITSGQHCRQREEPRTDKQAWRMNKPISHVDFPSATIPSIHLNLHVLIPIWTPPNIHNRTIMAHPLRCPSVEFRFLLVNNENSHRSSKTHLSVIYRRQMTRQLRPPNSQNNLALGRKTKLAQTGPKCNVAARPMSQRRRRRHHQQPKLSCHRVRFQRDHAQNLNTVIDRRRPGRYHSRAISPRLRYRLSGRPNLNLRLINVDRTIFSMNLASLESRARLPGKLTRNGAARGTARHVQHRPISYREVWPVWLKTNCRRSSILGMMLCE